MLRPIPSPPTRRTTRARPRPAPLAPLLVGLLAGLMLAGWGAPLRAQQTAPNGATNGAADSPGAPPEQAPREAGAGALDDPAPNGGAGGFDDPARDILIEGIGFSKLILEIRPEPDATPDPAAFRALMPLMEKNLCWSGLFHLYRGETGHCRVRGTPSRVDMRIRIVAGRDGRVGVQLRDAGPEAFVLFEEVIPDAALADENTVIDLVNRLAERVTGDPGLLGSTIAFVLRQPGYSKVIVATTTHGERLKLISANPDISLLPRWSPTGDAIVYTVLGRNGSAVYYHNLLREPDETGRSRFLTPRSGLNSGGAFSPDEERLVFTMSPNESADLYAYDFDTGDTRRLTFRDGIETSAVWSPSGEELVFVSDRSGTPQIYLLDLETLEDLRLTFDSSYNADPKWSPDGEQILFTSRVNGRDQIHVMNRYGDNVRPVTKGPYDSEQAEWSPDGKQIVFTSNRSGTYKLYVVSADGSNLRRLTRTPERFEETSPSWTWRRMPR